MLCYEVIIRSEDVFTSVGMTGIWQNLGDFGILFWIISSILHSCIKIKKFVYWSNLLIYACEVRYYFKRSIKVIILN
jgi:hypothetical protein